MTLDISEFLPVPKARQCKFGTAYGAMSDEQREKIDAVRGRKDVSAEKMAEVVTGWGFPVSEDVIRKHRIERCCCD